MCKDDCLHTSSGASFVCKLGVSKVSVCVCGGGVGWEGHLQSTNPADQRDNLKLLNKAAKCVRPITKVT